MDFIARDLRHALRKLAASPLFTLIALSTLAVGIGANTAVFSVVHGVLLKPLPFPEPDRLVGVWHTAPGLGWDRVNQSPALYFTYREESQVFDDTGMWDNAQVSITGLEEPEQVAALFVTDGIFPILGVRPEIGRLFSAEDDSPGTAETVLLSHDYWHRRLGGDPEILGRTLTIDGRPREVIGVMPANLHFLDEKPAVYLPFRFDRGEVFFGNFSYQGIARLAPGATLAQAHAEMERMIPMALDRFPMPPGFTKGMVAEVGFAPRPQPLKAEVVGDVGTTLWVLLGTVGLVLLVACANVANLFLVRAEARRQELATRAALGASRGQILRELLLESLLLAVGGGILGLGLAAAGLSLLRSLSPRGLPRIDEIAIDPAVLAFTAGISLFAALAFGALPALRLGTERLFEALKEGGRGSSSGKGRQRIRNALVVSQVALALVLLIGSGLMVRSFHALSNVNPGFVTPEDVLTLRLSIPSAEVEDGLEAARVHETILAKLGQLPGVTSVGMSTSITMDGWDSNDPIFIEDFPVEGDQLPPLRRFKWVSPGYFETMGNPVLAGRGISWGDIHDRDRVVVISEDLARLYWPDPAMAVGRRLKPYPQSPWRTIVGVVGPVRDDGVDQAATPVAYWPMVQESFFRDGEVSAQRSMAYVIRSSRVGTAGFLDEVRAAVWSVNSSLPLANVRTLEEILRRSTARTSFTLVMLAIAAAAALLLGAVGIYGVTSYAVSQRSGEIGVRMALGARRRDVSGLVLRHGLLLAGSGVVAGLVVAAGLTRLMAALLYGISPLDPVTYGAVGGMVTAIALLASVIPARRAAGVNPIEVLRRQ